jgi:hypothetical protein
MRDPIKASLLVAGLLATATSGAFAQTGDGQFCLKSMAGLAKCNYQTMAQCEQARGSGSSDQCVDRSQLGGTVGSGAASPPAGQPPATDNIRPPKAPPQ